MQLRAVHKKGKFSKLSIINKTIRKRWPNIYSLMPKFSCFFLECVLTHETYALIARLNTELVWIFNTRMYVTV